MLNSCFFRKMRRTISAASMFVIACCANCDGLLANAFSSSLTLSVAVPGGAVTAKITHSRAAATPASSLVRSDTQISAPSVWVPTLAANATKISLGRHRVETNS